MRSVISILLLTIFGSINASAVLDSRPDGITGETWQFGPLNRWAYTHIREILPTKNIANDSNLVQPIVGLNVAKDNLSINLDGKKIQLSDAMKSKYVDGILVLKNDIAVAELYDGTLTPERTHLMWSVSKTVTGLTAASLAADGFIDLNKRVADYVP